MLYIIAIVLGITVGLLNRGSTTNFLNVRLEKVWLFAAASIILIIGQAAGSRFSSVQGFSFVLQGLVFGLMLAGFWFNRYYAGMRIIGIGCLLNTLVIMLNGGRMPVSRSVIAAANLPEEALKTDIKHIVFQSGDGIRLPFLADIIYLPNIFGFLMRIVSIGDMVIAAGLFVLIFEIVVAGRKRAVNELNL